MTVRDWGCKGRNSEGLWIWAVSHDALNLVPDSIWYVVSSAAARMRRRRQPNQDIIGGSAHTSLPLSGTDVTKPDHGLNRSGSGYHSWLHPGGSAGIVGGYEAPFNFGCFHEYSNATDNHRKVPVLARTAPVLFKFQ